MPAETGLRTSDRPSTWSMLFRVFELARDPYKIFIAIIAVIVLTIGWGILGVIAEDATHGRWPANADRGANPFLVATSPDRGSLLFTWELWFGSARQDAPLQMEPFRQFYQPVLDLVRYSPFSNGWRNWWYAMLGVVFTLIVWGLAAGAITRIAAMQLARNEKVGIGEAYAYARRKLFDYIIGPAIPLIVFALLAFINALGTMICTIIPWLGSIITAILLPLPIIAGMAMAVMLVAFIGWPLFYATISTEGSDSFDAMSRTLAYITQGAWSYIKYTVAAFIFSVVIVFVVVLLASGSMYLVRWSMGLAPALSWHDTGDPVGSSFVLAPRSYQWRDLLVGRDHPMIRVHQKLNSVLLVPGKIEAFKKELAEKKTPPDLIVAELFKNAGITDKPPQGGELQTLIEYYNGTTVEELAQPQAKFDFLWKYMNGGQKLGAFITAFWTHGLFLVLVGFAYSLFWCSGTIIYFILRKEVDDTEMDEVYIEDERDFNPPPLASSVAPIGPPPVLPSAPVSPTPVTPTPPVAPPGVSDRPVVPPLPPAQ